MSELIKGLTWNEIKEDIKPIDKKLYNIIEGIAPDDSYKLYKVQYSYGVIIYDKGTFYLPASKNQYQPLKTNNSIFTKNLKSDLGYQAIPLGLLLNKCFEVYSIIEDEIFPLAFRRPGLELGIWETFAPSSPYTVSAGSRNIFLLPKISEASGHRKLRPLGVTKPKPIRAHKQWDIFKQLANHHNFSEDWTCEILFFSKEWINSMKEDPDWVYFYNYVMQKGWQHISLNSLSDPLKTQLVHDSVWDNFLAFLNKKNIPHPSNLTALTFKHLIAISSGVLPALKPLKAGDYKVCGPMTEIVKIYLKTYGLKQHIPTILHTDYLDPSTKDPVYYSLALPTSQKAASQSHKINSLKKELSELITLIDRFMEALSANKLGDSGEHLRSLFSHIQLDGFHVDHDIDYGIYPVEDLAKEDPNLLYSPFNMKDKTFCKTSAFVKGLIRISYKC